MLEKNSSGLEAAIQRGAQRRHHRYIGLLRAALPASMLTAVIAAAIYVAVLMLAGRRDLNNIAFMAAGSATIPLVATSLLIIISRRDNPASTALAVTIFATSLVVSALSASRIPISFTGILATMPTTLVGVALANLAIARSLKRSVAVLSFTGIGEIPELQNSFQIVHPDEVHANFHRLLIDPVAHHTKEYAPILARFYLRGIEIEAWPAFLESTSGRVNVDSFDLGDVIYSPSQILYYRSKRFLDLIFVFLLSLPAALLFVLAAVYIGVIDGGPVVFSQERRGYAGSTFRLYKLRTMYKGSHEGSTSSEDDRIMPGCHLIRQFRIDELPQLYNIFLGQMSVIGPRPVSVAVAENLEATIPQYANRQILTPGLTGWAQVCQGYAETAEEEIVKLSYDLYYLKNVSFDLDVIIIFRTLRTLLLRVGAR